MRNAQRGAHLPRPLPQRLAAQYPTQRAKHSRRGRRSRWTVPVLAVVICALVGSCAVVPDPVQGDRNPATTPTVSADTDGDGLPDAVEVAGWRTRAGAGYRTDANMTDTDGDGLTDSDEAGALVIDSPSERVYAGISDPTKTDSDEDGIDDRAELRGWKTKAGVTYRTMPMDPDTDRDGLYDGDEAGALVESDVPAEAYSGFSNPLLVDTDDDGLGDAAEADLSLDPFDPDSDGDQIEDGREVQDVGTAPDLADTDGDGLDDGYEDTKRESQGLDPLRADVKVHKWDYAADFAQGAVAGDLWRKDSIAWFAGNLVSGGASFIPGVGWVVGTVADVRDAIGSAIKADWVGVGFSAVGLIPDVGDAVAIPGKAARFVARVPKLAPEVAATIVVSNKVPAEIKIQASKQIWSNWDALRGAGASEKSLLQLQQGRTDLDELAAAIARSAPAHGSNPTFLRWQEAELFLEDLYVVKGAAVAKQVRKPTKGCSIDVCKSQARIIDVVADGVAHEVKTGRVPWTPSVQNQIREDAWLIKNGDVRSAHWDFFPSSTSNTIGADKRVFEMLDAYGIPYTIHLPAGP